LENVVKYMWTQTYVIATKDEFYERLVTRTFHPVKSKTYLNCLSKTTLRVINSSQNIVYSKKKWKPLLNEIHKIYYVQGFTCYEQGMEQYHFQWWKKFDYDRPSWFAYYWNDIRKESKYFSKRQHDGGSVMIWESIGYHGRGEICAVYSIVDSIVYVCEL